MKRINIVLSIIVLLIIGCTYVFAVGHRQNQEQKNNPVTQRVTSPLFLEHKNIKEPLSFDKLFLKPTPIYDVENVQVFDDTHHFNYPKKTKEAPSFNGFVDNILIALLCIVLRLLTYAITNRASKRRKKHESSS